MKIKFILKEMHAKCSDFFRGFPEKYAQRVFDHNFHLCNFLVYVLYPNKFVTNKKKSVIIKETMICFYSDRPILTLYLIFTLPATLIQVRNTIHFRASYKGFINCAELASCSLLANKTTSVASGTVQHGRLHGPLKGMKVCLCLSVSCC